MRFYNITEILNQKTFLDNFVYIFFDIFFYFIYNKKSNAGEYIFAVVIFSKKISNYLFKTVKSE